MRCEDEPVVTTSSHARPCIPKGITIKYTISTTMLGAQQLNAFWRIFFKLWKLRCLKVSTLWGIDLLFINLKLGCCKIKKIWISFVCPLRCHRNLHREHLRFWFSVLGDTKRIWKGNAEVPRLTTRLTNWDNKSTWNHQNIMNKLSVVDASKHDTVFNGFVRRSTGATGPHKTCLSYFLYLNICCISCSLPVVA